MKSFKNMIVRRRPSLEHAPVTRPLPEEDMTAAAQPCDADPQEPVEERDDAALARDIFLRNAQQARDHVPRPEYPAPPEQFDWNASQRGTTRLVTPESPASPAPKIWDIDPEAAVDAGRIETGAQAEPAPAPGREPPQAPQAAAARPEAEGQSDAPVLRPPRRVSSERVKTRLLGFHSADMESDAFQQEAAKSTAAPFFPIGWLVVVDGPGRGASFTLLAGLSTIGRDADQTVSLDFGDTSISRERHASVAYDEDDNRVYIGHGGKANIVKLNDKPLLSTEELNDGDRIRIGKTVLRYVGFCTEGFSWQDGATEEGCEAQDG